ncbi:MAG: hypothetical protein ACJAU1_001928 [Psychromonas sp.]
MQKSEKPLLFLIQKSKKPRKCMVFIKIKHSA